MTSTWEDIISLNPTWWMPGGRWDVYETMTAPEGYAYPTFERLKQAFIAAIVISVVRLLCDHSIFDLVAALCVPKPKPAVLEHKLNDAQKSKLQAFYKAKIDIKAKKHKKSKDGRTKFPSKQEVLFRQMFYCVDIVADFGFCIQK
jgi:hypothetical protein